MALGSAVLEGAGLILEKKTLMKEHAMEFTASMALFAMLFTTPLWFFSRAIITLGALGWIFLASLTTTLTIFFIAKAFRHLAISYTTPFLAFGPLVTAVLASIFLGESLNAVQWIGVLVLLLGAYLLHSHTHRDLLAPFKHAANTGHMNYMWLGILFYAITGLLDKKIVGSAQLAVPVVTYLVLLFYFMGVISVVMMLIFHDGFKGIGNGMRDNHFSLSGVALLTIGFKALVITAISLPGAMISLIIPIKKMSALFSTLIGGEMFHEEHVLRKTIACSIMVLGAVLVLL